MKTYRVAVLLKLSVGSAALGQQAVQWKVADGGNGHWYGATPASFTWSVQRDWCVSQGGHLATLTSQSEWQWVKQALPVVEKFVGAFQDHSDPSYAEPTGGWKWVTGEPFILSSYTTIDDCPGGIEGSCGCVGNGNQDVLFYTGCCDNQLDDIGDGIVAGCDSTTRRGVIEWSADCNNDGIVDYGQCRDGSLPDYNGNNIPDCCEQGTTCVVGSYPVQWRVSEGGNGHWYSYVHNLTGWNEARTLAVGLGGHLATISDIQENSLVILIASPAPETAWIGGLQDPDACEPSCGWRWITEEPWNFTAWVPGEPNSGIEDALLVWPGRGGWNDGRAEAAAPFVVEWSADCTNDGIVDKGQILAGQLADSDNNGVPDVCQEPSCRDADFFRDHNVNGADLGILLSQWGPNTPFTVSDLTGDGAVNGEDLGILLSFWGPCPD